MAQTYEIRDEFDGRVLKTMHRNPLKVAKRVAQEIADETKDGVTLVNLHRNTLLGVYWPKGLMTKCLEHVSR